MIKFNRQAIADARARIGINQSELARRMGISRQMINEIECEERAPNVTTLLRIMNALGVNNASSFFSFYDPILFRQFNLDDSPSKKAKMTTIEKAYHMVSDMRDQLTRLLVELSAELPNRRCRKPKPLLATLSKGKTVDLRGGGNGRGKKSSTAYRQKARRVSSLSGDQSA